MECFGENFRGGGGPVICPLCETHLDNKSTEFAMSCREKRDRNK